MIPWVITLLALFGWNALAPEHGRIRKGDSLGEIGLSQISDEPEIASRVANPELLLPTGRCTLWMEPRPAWSLILISKRAPLHLGQNPAGEVRGRAPPAIGDETMA